MNATVAITAQRIVEVRPVHPSLLAWLVVTLASGLLVGAIARLLVPGEQSLGICSTLAVGLTGSFFAGLVLRLLAIWTPLLGLLASITVAALLVVALDPAGERSHDEPA